MAPKKKGKPAKQRPSAAGKSDGKKGKTSSAKAKPPEKKGQAKTPKAEKRESKRESKLGQKPKKKEKAPEHSDDAAALDHSPPEANSSDQTACGNGPEHEEELVLPPIIECSGAAKGMSVLAQYRDSCGPLCAGTVQDFCDDGTFSIAYENGTSENVPISRLRSHDPVWTALKNALGLEKRPQTPHHPNFEGHHVEEGLIVDSTAPTPASSSNATPAHSKKKGKGKGKKGAKKDHGKKKGKKAHDNHEAELREAMVRQERIALLKQRGWAHLHTIMKERPEAANVVGEFGETPLLQAAGFGHLEIVRSLVKLGVDVDRPDAHGQTPFIRAASTGHVDVVNFFLDRMRAGLRQPSGKAGKGEGLRKIPPKELPPLLHGENADTPATDESGTAADTAAAPPVDAIELEYRAAVEDAALVHGPVRSVSCAGHQYEWIDPETDITAAIPENTRCHVKDKEVKRCYNVIRTHYEPVQPEDDVEDLEFPTFKDIFDFLTGRGEVFLGGYPSDRQKWKPLVHHIRHTFFVLDDGRVMARRRESPEPYATALLEAARHGHKSVVTCLADVCGNVDMASGEGDTALAVAAGAGRIEVVNELLRLGANVNSAGRHGDTPLHMAAKFGSLDIIQQLLERGASLDGENLHKETPLHVASLEGHIDVVKLMVEKGVEKEPHTIGRYTPLHAAAGRGHAGIVKFLADNGADVHARTRFGHTALMRAAKGAHYDVVDLLATWKPKKGDSKKEHGKRRK